MQTQQSINKLQNVLMNIKAAEQIYRFDKELELSASYLHNSIDLLEEILGLSKDLSFVDELFAKFCVGK